VQNFKNEKAKVVSIKANSSRFGNKKTANGNCLERFGIQIYCRRNKDIEGIFPI
jgi:hypothetical protein